jgi:proteasome lid subunit RPN8/RPN11
MGQNEHHEEEEKPSLLRKIIVGTMGLFLVFLMLSTFLVWGNVGEIVAGWIESETVENGLVELEDYSVLFSNGTYEILLSIYNDNQEHETKVCLFGNIENSVYNVTYVYQPVIYSQQFNQVVSQSCPSETVVALHSHPNGHCIASEQDLYTLSKSKEVNENIIIGVMCEEDRFSFYQ